MTWPWQKTETRESGSYTDALVQAILRTAGGNTLAVPGAAAAVEMASGIVHRAFQVAHLENAPEYAIAALTPAVRGLIGRNLMRRGEVIFVIEVVGGRLRLLPASNTTITGGADPRSWLYECTLAGPSTTRTIRRMAPDRVVHIMYSQDAERPWRGVGPIQSAATAARLSGALAGALADESSTTRGYVLPTPKDGMEDTLDDLETDLGGLNGGLIAVETMAGQWGTERASGAPGWKAVRLGADPPQSLVNLHEVATREILGAFGLSPALFSQSQGTAAREAWRQCLHGLVQPLAAIVQAELRVKLDAPELSMNFDQLMASDLSGRARAFQSMVGAGMAPDRAAALAGLMNIDDG